MLKNQPANPFTDGYIYIDYIGGSGLQPPNPHTATRGSIRKGLLAGGDSLPAFMLYVLMINKKFQNEMLASDELDLCIGLKITRNRPMT